MIVPIRPAAPGRRPEVAPQRALEAPSRAVGRPPGGGAWPAATSPATRRQRIELALAEVEWYLSTADAILAAVLALLDAPAADLIIAPDRERGHSGGE